MADDDRIENEQPESEEEDEEDEEDDSPPEEILAMQSLYGDLQSELKRLRAQKRTTVTTARANQLGIADLSGEVYDELLSMQEQMIALTEMSMKAIDSALQWCGELSDHTGFGEDEDEDEDEGDEGGGDSFLTHEDAALIGTVIVRSLASAQQAERDASVVDWKALREQLEVAGQRVSAIEDKSETGEPETEPTN